MTGQDGIATRDALQKISSAGLIIGFVLIAAGGTWPLFVAFEDMQTGARVFGAYAVQLQACSLLLVLGFWAATVGMGEVHRSIVARGADWARWGFYFLTIGATLWTIGMSLDITYSAALVNWQTAPREGKETAHIIAQIFSGLGFGRGFFPLEVIEIWMALGFMGIGMVRSRIYPRWLGLAGLVLGVVGVPLGIAETFTGREASLNIFKGLMVLTTFWFLAVGIWVARRAWRRAG